MALKIVFVSTFPPKACGIGVYTNDLIKGILEADPQTDWRVLAIEDPGDVFSYPFPVRRTIVKEDLDSVAAAARWINASGTDIVSIQHEFGIWGGFDGAFIMPFLDALRVPVQLTIHAVPMTDSSFNRSNRESLLRQIIPRVNCVSTFIPRAREFLIDQCGADPEKTSVVWHGAPPLLDNDRSTAKAALGLSSRIVIATFGLLSRFKGIHVGIEALAMAGRSDVTYLVLGQPHPYEPASLMPELRALADRCGVGAQVRWETRFLTEEEIGVYLDASDIYLTPYVEPTQISSGTLTRAMAAGCAIISTPYLYAEAALGDNRGVLVPFSDAKALSNAIVELVDHPDRRDILGQRARSFAAELAWSTVGARFLEDCRRAL